MKCLLVVLKRYNSMLRGIILWMKDVTYATVNQYVSMDTNNNNNTTCSHLTLLTPSLCRFLMKKVFNSESWSLVKNFFLWNKPVKTFIGVTNLLHLEIKWVTVFKK